jgi:hypothetical protein
LYSPASGDPSSASSQFIQIVENVIDGQPERGGSFIDNGSGVSAASPPYYPFTYLQPDSNTGITLRYFTDAPQDQGKRTSRISWTAETYLAATRGETVSTPTGTANVVYIYNGMKWGWDSEFTPPSDPGGGGGGGGGGGYGINALQPLSADGFAFAPDLQVNASSEAAPEPTTIVGAALAIGAWTGVSWRKRKKLKP